MDAPAPSANAPLTVLAIDPGREKCGIAIVRAEPGQRLRDSLLHREILPTPEIAARLRFLTMGFAVEIVLIGDGTGSDAVQKAIAATLPPQTRLEIVPEKYSTQHARALYFRLNPPRGWRRLIPASLQTPPCPVDDYAAFVLALEYFRRDDQVIR